MRVWWITVLILGWMSFHLGCKKQTAPTISAEEAIAARSHFERHLMAIGAGSVGIPHTGLKMNGSMEVMGQTGKNLFAIEQKIPNLYYVRISLSGVGVFERGYDGQQFWERTPRGSRFLSKEEVASLESTIDFQRWKNHAQWYPTITQVFETSFGGELCTALKVQTHDNREETLFFAKQSGLLMGIEKSGETKSVVRYGQYLPQGDIKMPTYWEEKTGDIHKIWRVEQLEWDRNEVDFRPPPSLLEERR